MWTPPAPSDAKSIDPLIIPDAPASAHDDETVYLDGKAADALVLPAHPDELPAADISPDEPWVLVPLDDAADSFLVKGDAGPQVQPPFDELLLREWDLPDTGLEGSDWMLTVEPGSGDLVLEPNLWSGRSGDGFE